METHSRSDRPFSVADYLHRIASRIPCHHDTKLSTVGIHIAITEPQPVKTFANPIKIRCEDGRHREGAFIQRFFIDRLEQRQGRTFPEIEDDLVVIRRYIALTDLGLKQLKVKLFSFLAVIYNQFGAANKAATLIVEDLYNITAGVISYGNFPVNGFPGSQKMKPMACFFIRWVISSNASTMIRTWG
jgi:hypothetical protein